MTYLTENLASVIAAKSRPAITVWNRLEGRPRAESFDRALRAEVRDPLWMLTRQWQMGEFIGDDAASPIDVKVHVETTTLTKYQSANGPVEQFTTEIPLEAHVERLEIPFAQEDLGIALDLRLLMGRQWLKMIRSVSAVPAVATQFIGRYPIHTPVPADLDDAPICAHPQAWASFAATANRRMDGHALYEHLTSAPGNHATDGIPALAGMEAAVDPVAARFVRWFQRVFYQPPGPGAWLPDRLEYQFSVSAPQGDAEQVLVADEYFHGHLDWYNLDVDPDRKVLGKPEPPVAPERHTLSMLPTQATFNGMPNSRWWRFEDTRTNFGDIRPDTTDLAKLLLVEFGLVYANDWYLVPFTVPSGTLARVRGIAVTDVFGRRTWVEPAGRGDDEDWQRWAMFHLSARGTEHREADLALLLPPAARQVQDGRPLEEVMLVRDEMANMVWAVERTITLPSGEPATGREAATQTRAFFERDLERRLGRPPVPPPFAEGAKIRYQVMSSVPENWIPMIPVHVDGDSRQIQLRRAAMLRILEGEAAHAPVRPRTALLREGLDDVPQTGYLLHEEEVPRAGTVITTSFQRTRWNSGRVWTWLGMRKRTGRGESSSGLAFDRLVDPPASS